MGSLIPTVLRAALGQPPRLVCARAIWLTGVDELRRRAGGRRESGAFLLGQRRASTDRIQHFLFYDDIDPDCFRNGIVEFDGRYFGKVWELCRTAGQTVVADVHVHPHGCRQSPTDRRNPMIAQTGHVAVILPDYATGKIMPGDIGIYDYQGSRQWRSFGRRGNRILHIGWWPL
jgi:proteasome lid subunit RPN8/RPN11